MKLIFAFAELFVGLVLYHELIPSNAAGQNHKTQPYTARNDIEESMNLDKENTYVLGRLSFYICKNLH